MNNLNIHDKETVCNCIKQHIINQVDKNNEIIKKEGIGYDKICLCLANVKPCLLHTNMKLNKDIKHLDQAVYPNKNLSVD